MKKLPVLCPQNYYGAADMRVEPCERCSAGWSKTEQRCTIETGAEGLPLANVVPSCPIADRCQHQIQAGKAPCAVRAVGAVCESALIFAGATRDEAAHSPIGFNAGLM